MRTEYFSVGVYMPLLYKKDPGAEVSYWKIVSLNCSVWEVVVKMLAAITQSEHSMRSLCSLVASLSCWAHVEQKACSNSVSLPSWVLHVLWAGWAPHTFGRYGNETYPKKYRYKDGTSARSTTQESCILKDKMFIIGGKGENYCSW